MPPEAPTDTAEDLLRLGAWRDAEAWSRLVARHGAAMYQAAFAVLRDENLAADACQEAFLHVRDGARRFKPLGDNHEAVAKAWLLRVATTSALRLRRDAGRRHRRERPLPEDL